MNFKAERADGSGETMGFYMRGRNDLHYLVNDSFARNKQADKVEIKFETLQVFFRNKWQLVSELKKPCVWRWDETEEAFFTGCGDYFRHFKNEDDLEYFTRFRNCPYCSRIIKKEG
jgi:hypothetical protein